MGPLRCVVCEEPKLYSQPWKPRQGGVLRLRRSSLYGTLNGPPNGDYHASPQIGSARWRRQQSFAPTGIKISPRTRASETARIVAKELGELPVICASGLYLATLNDLHRARAASTEFLLGTAWAQSRARVLGRFLLSPGTTVG